MTAGRTKAMVDYYYRMVINEGSIYRELFSTDQLLVTGSVDEYYDLVEQAPADENFN